MQVTSLTAYQPQTVRLIFGIGLFSIPFEWSDDSNKGNMIAPYCALFLEFTVGGTQTYSTESCTRVGFTAVYRGFWVLIPLPLCLG
jgi:hypothetical protein